MRREGIEVLTQAITGRDGDAILGQPLGYPVDQAVRIRLGALPTYQANQALAQGIFCRSYPEPLTATPHFVHQFIQLNMRHHQILE